MKFKFVPMPGAPTAPPHFIPKHSPGPWRKAVRRGELRIYSDAPGGPVCTVHAAATPENPTADFDHDVICAAPDTAKGLFRVLTECPEVVAVLTKPENQSFLNELIEAVEKAGYVITHLVTP